MHLLAAATNWDQEAATYAQKCWPTIDSYYNLVDLVRITPNNTVIDIGCGVGHIDILASIKQESPKNVWFVNQSAAMLIEARK